MPGYGDTYNYGDGPYKGNDDAPVTILKPEPVVFFAFDNRAFFFSHRSSSFSFREYRLTEFLRYGQAQNEFFFGD